MSVGVLRFAGVEFLRLGGGKVGGGRVVTRGVCWGCKVEPEVSGLVREEVRLVTGTGETKPLEDDHGPPEVACIGIVFSWDAARGISHWYASRAQFARVEYAVWAVASGVFVARDKHTPLESKCTDAGTKACHVVEEHFNGEIAGR